MFDFVSRERKGDFLVEDHGTLTQMATILAASLLGGSLVQKLGQPVLVGYIIAGILIGPTGFGLIGDQHQIMFLAELGILLLLFLVAIELDLKKFMPVCRTAVTVTALQITVSLAAMAALGSLFDWPSSRILLLGFAVSLSSTAVTLKLLQDMNQLDSPLGRTAIGILIAQDLAVIPMLLIIGTMGGGTLHFGEIVKIVAAMGFMAALIYYLNHKPEKIVKWVEKIPAGSQSTVIAIGCCFGAAALSGALGLSTAYGAFLAGLVIGNTSKHHIYEKNIRPLFDILIMVFFLSIGLLIDLSFIWENILFIVPLLLLTMVIKTTVNTALLRWQGMARHDALITGATLSQIGEFSFVLAALGLSEGSIMQDGYKYVVTLIALSLVFTPAWLHGMRYAVLLRRCVRIKWRDHKRSAA